MPRIWRKKRRKKIVYNPSREFVERAVAEYLAKGGTITKIENIHGTERKEVDQLLMELEHAILL